jgi:hypothetical protein
LEKLETWERLVWPRGIYRESKSLKTGGHGHCFSLGNHSPVSSSRRADGFCEP